MRFLVALALTGRRMIAVAAATLFVVHPAHVESLLDFHSQGLVAAAFTLLSFLAYLCYRREGDKAYWWYGASVFLFLLGVAGKLSVATFPAILLALDLFVEKRPLKRSLLDKVPFLVVGVVIALALFRPATDRQSSMRTCWPQHCSRISGYSPDSAAMSYSTFLRSNQRNGISIPSGGIASCRFRCTATAPSSRAADDDADLLDPIRLDPRQVLSFVHPVADRYLFFPSVALVILIAWWAILIGEQRGGRWVWYGGFTTAGHSSMGTRDNRLFERMAGSALSLVQGGAKFLRP